MAMDVSSSRPSNKANIFLGLIKYELNSLLGASHLVDYISVHIRFDFERYLLISKLAKLSQMVTCSGRHVVCNCWWYILCLLWFIVKLHNILILIVT